jgi:hypothetical protein
MLEINGVIDNDVLKVFKDLIVCGLFGLFLIALLIFVGINGIVGLIWYTKWLSAILLG